MTMNKKAVGGIVAVLGFILIILGFIDLKAEAESPVTLIKIVGGIGLLAAGITIIARELQPPAEPQVIEGTAKIAGY